MVQKNITKIEELTQEIVEGNTKNLSKLKKELNDFFKNKDQSFFNTIPKEKLSSFVNVQELISTKKKFSETEKARLDFWLNEPMKKYFSLEISKVIKDKELKKLTETIYNEFNFINEKQKTEFLASMAWTWIEGGWEDYSLEDKEKTILIEFNFGKDLDNNENSLHLLVLCNKNKKRILEKIEEVFK